MIDIQTLIHRADAYKVASGIARDTTVSSRVFGDSKKLAAIRNGADITVTRFNDAMKWFDLNWPVIASPAALADAAQDFRPQTPEDAA